MTEIGFNVTSQESFDVSTKISTDYLEILVDNFYHFEDYEIMKLFAEKKCAFHIMSSNFITEDKEKLKLISKNIKRLKSLLNPIYISDHLMQTKINNTPLSRTCELNYSKESLNAVIDKVNFWQDMLDKQLLLENFPSLLYQNSKELHQVDFLLKLREHTGCSILLDISNISISINNLNESADNWLSILSSCQHFHIGGYGTIQEDSTLLEDTHDTCVSQSSLELLSTINKFSDIKTLTVERDFNLDSKSINNDLKNVRKCIYESYNNSK